MDEESVIEDLIKLFSLYFNILSNFVIRFIKDVVVTFFDLTIHENVQLTFFASM
jgi:hypothetical protein